MIRFALAESHLESSLESAIVSAKENAADGELPMSMEELVGALSTKAESGDDDMDSEVFDLIFSLGDFAEFASLMLSWREQMVSEGPCAAGVGASMTGSRTPSMAAATTIGEATDLPGMGMGIDVTPAADDGG